MDYFDSDFERRKMEPMYWFNKSVEMRNSAGALWYALSHHIVVGDWLRENCSTNSGANYSVFHMLCGLSLELIYKAIIVSGGKSPRNTHDLNKLREDAEIDANEQEIAILEIYKHTIYWQGKYPAANKSESHREYSRLVEDHLYEQVPGLHPIVRPNNLMGWDMFSALWDDGSAGFVEKNPHLFGSQ